jgi:hypothetical protein
LRMPTWNINVILPHITSTEELHDLKKICQHCNETFLKKNEITEVKA